MVEKIKQDLVARRADLSVIYDLIDDNTRVLDLGCGDGMLLKYLREMKNVRGCGVELGQDKIIDCVVNGVPVIHKNLNDGLSGFNDKSYDYVILSQTLQAVARPDSLLEEMLRVGKRIVISFINFGYLKVRLQLLFSGEMPTTKTLPDAWYDTANTHLATIRDFKALCRLKKAVIIQQIPLSGTFGVLASQWPNLFASTCVFVVSSAED